LTPTEDAAVAAVEVAASHWASGELVVAEADVAAQRVQRAVANGRVQRGRQRHGAQLLR
jgi:hypothetical protein